MTIQQEFAPKSASSHVGSAAPAVEFVEPVSAEVYYLVLDEGLPSQSRPKGEYAILADAKQAAQDHVIKTEALTATVKMTVLETSIVKYKKSF